MQMLLQIKALVKRAAIRSHIIDCTINGDQIKQNFDLKRCRQASNLKMVAQSFSNKKYSKKDK
jgi:hypothetical protein